MSTGLGYLSMGLVYGSTTGRTEDAAEMIREQFPWHIEEAVRISRVDPLDDLTGYDVLIVGISTWDIGQLQREWEDVFDDLARLDVTDVRVAFFGLGDQAGYPDNFLDAMGILRTRLLTLGATCDIGWWPTDDYEFTASVALVDGQPGHFVGLALDDDNQYDLTEERIEFWCAQLRKELERTAE